jgi:L-lactate dehydrogenase (cytochrome)
LSGPETRGWSNTGAVVESNIRPADVAWLRENWDGPVVVKGVLGVPDALAAVDAGASAVVVSNHGGRQLDRTPSPLTVLPEIAHAVGARAEIFVDSGFRTGSDVAAAVGLGATAVMIGRPYLFGLMAAGERGVTRVIDIFRNELRRTMTLLGAATVQDIGPDQVSIGSSATPRRTANPS